MNFAIITSRLFCQMYANCRGKKGRLRLFTSSIHLKLGIFTSWSCSDGKETLIRQKDAREKLLICKYNLLTGRTALPEYVEDHGGL